MKESYQEMQKRMMNRVNTCAGQIREFEGCTGFLKVDKDPKTFGNCIEANCVKLVEMWSKIPHTRESTVLKYAICNSTDKPINHIMIYNKKRNQIIDMFNSQIKMVDYNFHKECNAYTAEIDITFEFLQLIINGALRKLMKKLCPEISSSNIEDMTYKLWKRGNWKMAESYLRNICNYYFAKYRKLGLERDYMKDSDSVSEKSLFQDISILSSTEFSSSFIDICHRA